VAFAWDSPAAYGIPDEEAKAVGGFFFRRAHMPVAVTPVHIAPNDDPNRAFLEAAAPQRAAILWIYDLKISGTAAGRFPPRIATLDPHYTCRDFGQENVGVVTCTDNRPWNGPISAHE
jgi:hypothetical protein